MKDYQNEFKTTVSIQDEEIAYVPELHTHKEYDCPEDIREPEKEKWINVIRDSKDGDKMSGTPSIEENDMVQETALGRSMDKDAEQVRKAERKDDQSYDCYVIRACYVSSVFESIP